MSAKRHTLFAMNLDPSNRYSYNPFGRTKKSGKNLLRLFNSLVWEFK